MKALFYFFILILIASSVQAWGVSPSSWEIQDAELNTKYEMEWFLINPSAEEKIVMASIAGNQTEQWFIEREMTLAANAVTPIIISMQMSEVLQDQKAERTILFRELKEGISPAMAVKVVFFPKETQQSIIKEQSITTYGELSDFPEEQSSEKSSLEYNYWLIIILIATGLLAIGLFLHWTRRHSGQTPATLFINKAGNKRTTSMKKRRKARRRNGFFRTILGVGGYHVKTNKRI